jgi:glutathione synthase/RimK-type ligase-like ATP-grasp enzyme
MILLWGLPGDTPIALVHNALQQLGQPVIFFDQREVLASELELRLGTQIEGKLRIRQRAVEIEDIHAVYMRLYSNEQLPGLRELDRKGPAFSYANAVVDALTAWTELTPILIVNRPSAMESNGSKPYQMRLIHEQGFEIPDTVITTDPNVAREFWAKHGNVIYKSISGVRSIVAKLTPQHAERLALVRWCPTQFQEFIAGNDYRVHVVGDEIFASEITSTATDYRYARTLGTSAEMRSCVLPPNIADRCRSMAHSFGLDVAGIDLRRHPSGKWYCFEVNPSPGFSYFQDASGQSIDIAIAQLLISGKSFACLPKAPTL